MCRAYAALLVGIASLLPAQEPAPAKSIAQLIDLLSSQDFKVREAAAKEIEARGPEALPELRKSKDHPDLEVRRRIREWIPRFEIEAFVAPKRVSLDLKNEPLEKVVAELARQTGYQIELSTKDARARKRVSLHLVKATFWEAFDKVCREGELELNPGHGPEKLVLGFDGATSPTGPTGALFGFGQVGSAISVRPPYPGTSISHSSPATRRRETGRRNTSTPPKASASTSTSWPSHE